MTTEEVIINGSANLWWKVPIGFSAILLFFWFLSKIQTEDLKQPPHEFTCDWCHNKTPRWNLITLHSPEEHICPKCWNQKL